DAGDRAQEARHAAARRGRGTCRRTGCGSRCITSGVGRRRSGCGPFVDVARLHAEALAATGTACLGVKRQSEQAAGRKDQHRHGEKSREALRHYGSLLKAHQRRTEMKKAHGIHRYELESYRKLKLRTMA